MMVENLAAMAKAIEWGKRPPSRNHTNYSLNAPGVKCFPNPPIRPADRHRQAEGEFLRKDRITAPIPSPGPALVFPERPSRLEAHGLHLQMAQSDVRHGFRRERQAGSEEAKALARLALSAQPTASAMRLGPQRRLDCVRSIAPGQPLQGEPAGQDRRGEGRGDGRGDAGPHSQRPREFAAAAGAKSI